MTAVRAPGTRVWICTQTHTQTCLCIRMWLVEMMQFDLPVVEIAKLLGPLLALLPDNQPVNQSVNQSINQSVN